MIRWEYKTIALNQLPRKGDDIDLLCEVGLDGWELVAILASNMAYLKRQATGDRSSEETSDGKSVPVGFVNRPIPRHLNLVTPEGLVQIEETFARLEERTCDGASRERR